jgi:WD40-like Beta Propeller Repeat
VNTHTDGSGETNRLLSTLADGSGVTERLLDIGPRLFPSGWSPDGRVLALYGIGTTNTRDVLMLMIDSAKRTPVPFVATPFEERGAIFSPDGRWVAYVSNKTGQNDVFARPYPGPGAELTISVGGGQEPVWRASGKELFYRRRGVLQVVHVDATASELKVGASVRVFVDPFRIDTGGANGIANYDISPDGKRFVMIEEPKPQGIDAGWPLHHVQEMLGHSSIEQTSTYLNVERVGLQGSMRKNDELRTRCNPVAIKPEIEHPLHCNDDRKDGENITVN